MRKIIYSLLVVVAAGVCFAGCSQEASPKKEQSPSVTKPASDDDSQTKDQDDAKPAPPSDGSGYR